MNTEDLIEENMRECTKCKEKATNLCVSAEGWFWFCHECGYEEEEVI